MRLRTEERLSIQRRRRAALTLLLAWKATCGGKAVKVNMACGGVLQFIGGEYLWRGLDITKGARARTDLGCSMFVL